MMVHNTDDHGCRPGSELNIAGFLARSGANGPGIRAVVWVQGCPLRCTGCFNPEFWSFAPTHILKTSELAGRILALENIDGVTFSGGEPFAQAHALADLGRRLASAGLTVITFTGFSWDFIKNADRASWNRLLEVTDLLIAGPYRPDLACNLPLLGSSNQQLIPLSGKIPVPAGSPATPGQSTELTIRPDGSLVATGFPDTGFIRRLASHCRGV